MTDAPYDVIKQQLLDAALIHVVFDGWTPTTFRAAVEDTGIDAQMAENVCPKGALDLAILYHKNGDAAMLAALKSADLAGLRFRDKVAMAVRFRIEAVDDKEAVRRGSTLFALPHHAADGAKLVWGTADAIWTALGDTSEDVNWYTKRAILSGVYSSVILFWLGDDSQDTQATWDFLDRRIDNVMQFEKVKAQVNANPVLSKLLQGPNWLLSQIKAPTQFKNDDLPGQWNAPN
ncbi:COQ9 family protein [Algirhabdus cladophorae]|uniref:COQ9 family protein n=1 Tax=Algirhabdus cladophorae TaxID=3377108 RepID=UPI003B846E0D